MQILVGRQSNRMGTMDVETGKGLGWWWCCCCSIRKRSEWSQWMNEKQREILHPVVLHPFLKIHMQQWTGGQCRWPIASGIIVVCLKRNIYFTFPDSELPFHWILLFLTHWMERTGRLFQTCEFNTTNIAAREWRHLLVHQNMMNMLRWAASFEHRSDPLNG